MNRLLILSLILLTLIAIGYQTMLVVVGGIPLFYQPLETRTVNRLFVRELTVGGEPAVRVSGYVGDSSSSVKAYEVNTLSAAYRVNVYIGIWQGGRMKATPGELDFDIVLPLPRNVDRIEFGRSRAVIWQRQKHAST